MIIIIILWNFFFLKKIIFNKYDEGKFISNANTEYAPNFANWLTLQTYLFEHSI